MHTYINGSPAKKGDRVLVLGPQGKFLDALVSEVLANAREGEEDIVIVPVSEMHRVSAKNCILAEEAFGAASLAVPVEPAPIAAAKPAAKPAKKN